MEDFLQIVKARGLLYQASDTQSIGVLAKKKALRAYLGIDCTANGLHVGNLLPLMVIYWLYKTDNQALILFGGATSMIGDPSGKDLSRKLLSKETIDINKAGLKNDIVHLLTRHNFNPHFLDNTDWLQNWQYIDFARTIGSEVSISKLLAMESIKNRLTRNLNLSFLEFSYPLMQAYDFLHLLRQKNCNIQIGGSDQWGNIILGLDLIRKFTKKECYAFTTPLLVDSNNKKMGKTNKGAIWLCPKKYANLDFWQFWRNVEDQNVMQYLLQFTTLPLLEIKHLGALRGKEINHAKKILAYEVLKFVRGEIAANQTLKLAESVYENKEINKQLESYSVPSRTGLLVDWLVQNNILSSKSETRRLINNLGIKINDQLVQDVNYQIMVSDWQQDNCIKISIGKKRHLLFIFSE